MVYVVKPRWLFHSCVSSSWPNDLGTFWVQGKPKDAEKYIDTMFMEVRRPNTYLHHQIPISILITGFSSYKEIIPQKYQQRTEMIIDSLTRLKKDFADKGDY